MQVMGSVARELGYTQELPKLCQLETGLIYGCKKLAECLKKHPALPDALAAYNAGITTTEAGKTYAAKVLLIV
jgi:soluble lytic murein transglycosylase-like protein